MNDVTPHEPPTVKAEQDRALRRARLGERLKPLALRVADSAPELGAIWNQ